MKNLPSFEFYLFNNFVLCKRFTEEETKINFPWNFSYFRTEILSEIHYNSVVFTVQTVITIIFKGTGKVAL